MPASPVYIMSHSASAIIIGVWFAVGAPMSASANVITDWDEKAVAVVTPMPPYTAQRVMGMVHIAMFDAVNSIERRFRRYLVQLPAEPTTSKEAAAASWHRLNFCFCSEGTEMREHVLLFCLFGLVLITTILLVTEPAAVTWALALVE